MPCGSKLKVAEANQKLWLQTGSCFRSLSQGILWPMETNGVSCGPSATQKLPLEASSNALQCDRQHYVVTTAHQITTHQWVVTHSLGNADIVYYNDCYFYSSLSSWFKNISHKSNWFWLISPMEKLNRIAASMAFFPMALPCFACQLGQIIRNIFISVRIGLQWNLASFMF